jgi:hypothetical protein
MGHIPVEKSPVKRAICASLKYALIQGASSQRITFQAGRSSPPLNAFIVSSIGPSF